jgi:ribosomal subunit interface protein
MTIKVAGKHIEVGESLTNYLSESLKTVIDRHAGTIIEVNATIGKDHHNFVTDIQVSISHNLTVNCHGTDVDAYKSVSQAVDRLDAKIKKYKSRLRDTKRNHEKNHVASGYVIEKSLDDCGQDIPVTIAETAYDVERLTVGNAVMKLELSDYPVMVFKNAGNDRVNIVYRRPDGNFGWIDPK